MLDDIKKFEVGIHAQAADMEFTLVGLSGCGGEDKTWQLTLTDTSPDDIRQGQPRKKVVVLDHNEASAVMALFIGELTDETLNARIYEIAEKALEGVSHNLRPIP